MIIVLAYHSISHTKYEHAVTPEVFEMQLQFLKRRCTMISVGELNHLIQSKEKVNGNYALITFDDGVDDIYTNAFPILKNLQGLFSRSSVTARKKKI
jgi:peptidoglycan/xylan/chitin deacetylase (PgdA/CDA1 family)